MSHYKRSGRVAAIVAALSMFNGPLAPLTAVARQSPPPAKPAAKPPATSTTQPAPKPQATPAPKPQATAAATAAPVDGGWPRVYDLASGGSILVYQPQVSDWKNQAHMVAFSAVSYRDPAGAKPALGTVKIEADTKVAVEDRLVNFQRMKITEANFQTVPKEQVREISATIEKAIPDDDRVIALDRVLANINKSNIVPKNVEGIKADPPAVFFSKTPAVIVNLDGDAIWSPIKENDLKYAVNTNWDLFQHGPTNTYYLRNNDTYPFVMPKPDCGPGARNLWQCEGLAKPDRIALSENLCQGEDDIGIYCWGQPTFTGWAKHWKGPLGFRRPG